MAQVVPSSPIVHLRPEDNVAVAAAALPEGAELAVGGTNVIVRERIEMGHKVALEEIRAGEPVRKYGQVIGFATSDVSPGQWVHTRNLEAGSFQRDYAFASEVPPDPVCEEPRTFLGYRRPGGKVGTRNYILVISTVNCSASVSRYITDRIPPDVLRRYPNVDGVMAITHKAGCAMQYAGDDHEQLNRILAGYARHPNVGAYLLVGLGCETGQASYLIESQGLVQLSPAPRGDEPARPARLLSIQQCGGINKTVEAGVGAVLEMLPEVDDVSREPFPASQLIVGTECGGSDGNSGVTANPAVGVASDLIVAQGGTAILAETPEIYGAEHLLTRRARTREIGEALVERIKWWERYTQMFGVEINNNPSAGNKAGGLTTIYEKSLGAVAKGGSSALAGVYRYAEPVTAKGFVVMDTPGYDPASITGMVAGGANVCVFTTGRGSCFGSKPVPTLKIATNTPMFEHMRDDMDVDAGVILDGRPVEEVGKQIFDEVLAVASGKKTKSEQQGVGEEEFVPWSIGPML